MSALNGIRVLDVSQVLAGPFCAQLMADNGAEVIRVESLEGDLCRNFPPARDGQSGAFIAVNRGKRGIALNLKTEQGRDVLQRLAARSDILVQNFLPARAKALGVDYETIRAVNPELIYVSISGYGAEGPLKDKPGLDMMVSAYAGIMSMTGEPDRPPVRVGTPAIDMSTGMMAYGAAMTALLARANGQGGQEVRCSLLQNAVNLLAFNATNWLNEGLVAQREGSGFLHLAPYEALQCQDAPILMGAVSDGGWQRICEALGSKALAGDERFITNADRQANRPVLREEIEAILKTDTAEHWIARFEAAGAVAAPVHTVDQVFAQEQVKANNLIVTAPDAAAKDGKLRMVGTPFSMTGTPGGTGAAPPRIGENTDDVLRYALDMSDSEIAALRDAGVVG
jgi:crotonobetainyl-CoA:carnitine CoA-transferase CaiB-like acyl-CoA transferase